MSATNHSLLAKETVFSILSHHKVFLYSPEEKNGNSPFKKFTLVICSNRIYLCRKCYDYINMSPTFSSFLDKKGGDSFSKKFNRYKKRWFEIREYVLEYSYHNDNDVKTVKGQILLNQECEISSPKPNDLTIKPSGSNSGLKREFNLRADDIKLKEAWCQVLIPATYLSLNYSPEVRYLIENSISPQIQFYKEKKSDKKEEKLMIMKEKMKKSPEDVDKFKCYFCENEQYALIGNQIVDAYMLNGEFDDRLVVFEREIKGNIIVIKTFENIFYLLVKHKEEIPVIVKNFKELFSKFDSVIKNKKLNLDQLLELHEEIPLYFDATDPPQPEITFEVKNKKMFRTKKKQVPAIHMKEKEKENIELYQNQLQTGDILFEKILNKFEERETKFEGEVFFY